LFVFDAHGGGAVDEEDDGGFLVGVGRGDDAGGGCRKRWGNLLAW